MHVKNPRCNFSRHNLKNSNRILLVVWKFLVVIVDYNEKTNVYDAKIKYIKYLVEEKVKKKFTFPLFSSKEHNALFDMQGAYLF